MKLNLFRFFAILLAILFIGGGQSGYANTDGTETIHRTHTNIKTHSLLSDSKEECFMEDNDDDDLVSSILKKNVQFDNGFIVYFGLSLPNSVQQHHIIKVAFSKRLPFCYSAKVSALYQVFRL